MGTTDAINRPSAGLSNGKPIGVDLDYDHRAGFRPFMADQTAQRAFQRVTHQPAAIALRLRKLDFGSALFGPDDVHRIVGQRPRDIQNALLDRKRSLFQRVGCKFMHDQRQRRGRTLADAHPRNGNADAPGKGVLSVVESQQDCKDVAQHGGAALIARQGPDQIMGPSKRSQTPDQLLGRVIDACRGARGDLGQT